MIVCCSAVLQTRDLLLAICYTLLTFAKRTIIHDFMFVCYLLLCVYVCVL